MRIAKRLAAVEVAIGIRSDQLDAWRRFTSLVVAFASPQWPDLAMAEQDDEEMDPGDDQAVAPDAATADQPPADEPAMPPAPKADTADTAPATDMSSFGPLGFMVDRAIERGDKARELKDAMAKLDAVLTPEQKQMARTLMRPGRHGMRSHGHWGRRWRGGDDRDGGHDRDNDRSRM